VNIDVPAAQVKRAHLMLPLHGSLSALHFSGVFFPLPDNFSGLDMAAIETKFFGFCRFPAWHAHCLSLIASRKGEEIMKNKRRAICILLVLSGILVLAGAWNLPEDPYMQGREIRTG
jgi:hypothetical protein